MNEVSLNDDLTIITTEIKSYQNIGGQAIFEIGRRLKHVKEHDLTHGKYMDWLKSININYRQASRFIKIATEFSNWTTSSNLGMNVLYEIATMPEEERNKPQQLDSGETKKPDEMTVRELREVKRKLKLKEEELQDKDLQIEQLQNQPKPEIKTVEKRVEVKPTDYDYLKSKSQKAELLQKQLDEAKRDVEFYQNELNKAEQNAKREAKLNDDKIQQKRLERKKRQAELNAYEISDKIKQLVSDVWLDNAEINELNRLGDEAKSNLIRNLDKLQEFVDRAHQALQGRTFIEGEIINDN